MAAIVLPRAEEAAVGMIDGGKIVRVLNRVNRKGHLQRVRDQGRGWGAETGDQRG